MRSVDFIDALPAFWPLVVVLTISGTLHLVFLRRLKRDHRDTWLAIGSPGYFGAAPTHFRILRFVWSEKHRTLTDPMLSRMILGLRVFMTVALAGFVVIGFELV